MTGYDLEGRYACFSAVFSVYVSPVISEVIDTAA